MKRLSLISAYLLILMMSVKSQSMDPVSWRFSAKKIGDRTFEVHCTATIQLPWHIYAQDSPEDATLPTTIQLAKNPLIEIQDKPKEVGRLVKKEDDITGLVLKYYTGQVDFVQVVKLKANVKTTLNGSIDYMACTDSQCLPPSQRKFTITLHQ